MKKLAERWLRSLLLVFNTLEGTLEKFPLSPGALPPPKCATWCKVQSLFSQW